MGQCCGNISDDDLAGNWLTSEENMTSANRFKAIGRIRKRVAGLDVKPGQYVSRTRLENAGLDPDFLVRCGGLVPAKPKRKQQETPPDAEATD